MGRKHQIRICNVTQDEQRNHNDGIKSVGNGSAETAAGNTADKTEEISGSHAINPELLHPDN